VGDCFVSCASNIVISLYLVYHPTMIDWKDEYSVGNSLIDKQHRELIQMTDELYTACRQGGGAEKASFIRTIHGAVRYVKEHFSTEEKIMKQVNYPDYEVHKKEHEDFIAEVLLQAKNYENNNPFVPAAFVKFLLEWIVTHIAGSDRKYVPYLPPEGK
jgi:hemerythrin